METAEKIRLKIMSHCVDRREKPYRLAVRAGVTPASLYRFLKGERDLRLGIYLKLINQMEKDG